MQGQRDIFPFPLESFGRVEDFCPPLHTYYRICQAVRDFASVQAERSLGGQLISTKCFCSNSKYVLPDSFNFNLT